MTVIIAGVYVPDSALIRSATELVRGHAGDVLYNHSRRAFFWAALIAKRRRVSHDLELLYLAAMFHDLGLTKAHASKELPFEIDGANAARQFLNNYRLPERDVEDIWNAIALHTTRRIAEHMRPTVALLTAGVAMDVLGVACHDVSPDEREQVCAHHPLAVNLDASCLDHVAQARLAIAQPLLDKLTSNVRAQNDPSLECTTCCCLTLASARHT
jgi:hypothetical protein